MNRLAALSFLCLLTAGPGCVNHYFPQQSGPSRDQWQRPKEVIEALAIQSGVRVADLGAGDGYFTFWLTEAVGPEGTVYAADIEQSRLDLIAEQARRYRLSNVQIVLATSDDPRLPADGVDLIFSCNVYHQMEDRVAYWRKAGRFLRAGGRVAVIDYKPPTWFNGWFRPGTGKDTIRKEMEAAGYRPVGDFDFLEDQHFLVFRLA
jgi:ubiquinone/menaquinone biosynthesis C-methylase UbiE